MTSTASGRGHLVLGDSGGQVHFLDRHLEVRTFKAFQRKLYRIHQLKRSGIFLAIGEDDPGINPYLKVYNLDKPDKNGNPSLVR